MEFAAKAKSAELKQCNVEAIYLETQFARWNALSSQASSFRKHWCLFLRQSSILSRQNFAIFMNFFAMRSDAKHFDIGRIKVGAMTLDLTKLALTTSNHYYT